MGRNNKLHCKRGAEKKDEGMKCEYIRVLHYAIYQMSHYEYADHSSKQTQNRKKRRHRMTIPTWIKMTPLLFTTSAMSGMTGTFDFNATGFLPFNSGVITETGPLIIISANDCSFYPVSGRDQFDAGNGWTLYITSVDGTVTLGGMTRPYGKTYFNGGVYYEGKPAFPGGQSGAWSVNSRISYRWEGNGQQQPTKKMYANITDYRGAPICRQIYPGEVEPPVVPTSCSVASKMQADLGTVIYGQRIDKEVTRNTPISCNRNTTMTASFISGCKRIESNRFCVLDVAGTEVKLSLSTRAGATTVNSRFTVYESDFLNIDVDATNSVPTVPGRFSKNAVLNLTYE